MGRNESSSQKSSVKNQRASRIKQCQESQPFESMVTDNRLRKLTSTSPNPGVRRLSHILDLDSSLRLLGYLTRHVDC